MFGKNQGNGYPTKGVPDTKFDTAAKFVGGFVVGYLGTKTVKTLVENHKTVNSQRGPQVNGVQYDVPQPRQQYVDTQQQSQIEQRQAPPSPIPEQIAAAHRKTNAEAAMKRLAQKNPNVAKFLEDNGGGTHPGQAQIPGPYDK